MSDEERFTLEEAEILLRRKRCQTSGHAINWESQSCFNCDVEITTIMTYPPVTAAERSEANNVIRAALLKLDGTDLAAVALLAGVTPEEIDELGGIPRQ